MTAMTSETSAPMRTDSPRLVRRFVGVGPLGYVLSLAEIRSNRGVVDATFEIERAGSVVTSVTFPLSYAQACQMSKDIASMCGVTAEKAVLAEIARLLFAGLRELDRADPASADEILRAMQAHAKAIRVVTP